MFGLAWLVLTWLGWLSLASFAWLGLLGLFGFLGLAWLDLAWFAWLTLLDLACLASAWPGLPLGLACRCKQQQQSARLQRAGRRKAKPAKASQARQAKPFCGESLFGSLIGCPIHDVVGSLFGSSCLFIKNNHKRRLRRRGGASCHLCGCSC